MILAKLAAATLIVSVTTAPLPDTAAIDRLSTQQKNAAVQVYIDSATNCIARVVAANPRFHRDDAASNLGDLIEASMHGCLTPMRAMIDALDLYFGNGTGERFFAGPYLDALPNVVVKLTVRAAN